MSAETAVAWLWDSRLHVARLCVAAVGEGPHPDLSRSELSLLRNNTSLSRSLRVGDPSIHGVLGWGPSPIAATQSRATSANATFEILSSRPRVLVLTAAGVNCDRETVQACRLAGAEPEAVHLNVLLSGERRIDEFAMVVLPGGFSYGDHLGAGAMLATVLRHRLLPDLERFIGSGRPVLGICNGFQVLARLGLLGPLALAPNSGGQFECRWVRLAVEPSNSIFLTDIEALDLPVAHGQGRVVVPESDLPGVLPHAPMRYVDNPNGSVGDIAGICNASGNVLGLMPHPERAVEAWQYPGRTSGPTPAGLRIFSNAIAHVRSL